MAEEQQGKAAFRVPLGASSAIETAVYHPINRELWIIFNGARGAPVYIYEDVSPITVGRWVTAGSVGQYFHRNIAPLGINSTRTYTARQWLRGAARAARLLATRGVL